MASWANGLNATYEDTERRSSGKGLVASRGRSPRSRPALHDDLSSKGGKQKFAAVASYSRRKGGNRHSVFPELG